MLDFDIFPDIGDGLFPLPEMKGCGNANDDNDTEVYPNEKMVLAMGYVPAQQFDDIYSDYSKALANGSLFASLVKPFYGGKGER